jgi:hypothetical protein
MRHDALPLFHGRLLLACQPHIALRPGDLFEDPTKEFGLTTLRM